MFADSVNLKKAAVLQFAIESLGSPDKKKLAKSLKKKKLDSDSPDQLKVTFGDSKLMPSKIDMDFELPPQDSEKWYSTVSS